MEKKPSNLTMHPAYTKLRLPPPKGEGKVPGTEWRHYKHAIHQNTPNLKYILPLRVQNRIKEAKKTATRLDPWEIGAHESRG